MQIPVTASGKLLPVPFAYGYVHALILASRSHIWKDYYRAAVGRFVPPAEHEHWLQLFERYLSRGEALPPLDYTTLRLVHALMLEDDDIEQQKMQQIAWMRTAPVGEAWWTGSTPLDRFRDYGLQRLLAPHILNQIHHNPDDTLFRKQSGLPVAIRATQKFVMIFAGGSKIAITTQTEKQQITVVITECPFCDQHPNCRVFWGVVIGFLDWLHGERTISKIRQHLRLNRHESTAHNIVLDIVDDA